MKGRRSSIMTSSLYKVNYSFLSTTKSIHDIPANDMAWKLFVFCTFQCCQEKDHNNAERHMVTSNKKQAQFP